MNFSFLLRRASIVLGSFALLMVAAPGALAGEITPTRDSSDITNAIAADPSLVTGSSFVTEPPLGPPNAVSDYPLASFATDGPSYAILSTGDPSIGPNKNFAPDSGWDDGGDPFQGTDNHDVTVLKVDVDVPAGTDCLTFNYRFLSEEFNEFIGEGFNDTFLVQLDRSDWSAGDQAVYAPGDFATTGASIGIDSTGDYAVSAANSAGTTYDAATALVTAKTRAAPGAHSVYFTIFDQGDGIYDSAVFIDKLQAIHADEGNCEPPAISNPAIADPVTPSVHDAPGSRIARLASRTKAKSLKAFRGSAAGVAGVSRVDVALIKVVGGAQASRRHRHGSPRCVNMTSRRLLAQRLPVAGKCTKLDWIEAQGTTSWSFDLKRKLPKGNYVLYSRAIDGSGMAESGFSNAKGNRSSFTVR